MIASFQQILERISLIERDIQELNRFKNRIPENRFYYSGLHKSFEEKLSDLQVELKMLMEQTVKNPPPWLLGMIKSVALENHSENKNNTLKQKGSGVFPDKIQTMSGAKSNIRQFFQEIPKTEIHLHLEACLSKESLRKLLEKNQIQVSEEEFDSKFLFKDLNGFIQLFFFIQSSVKSEQDFSILIDSLGLYMKRDNILYAEVYLAPTKFLQIGLNFEKMLNTIVHEIRRIKETENLEIRLLVDVSRTFGVDNAMNNLNRVLQLDYPEVIGIGLGGAELLGPAKDYEKVFTLARESGLRVVAHAGEDDGPWSIWDAINYLKVERIGHGTSAIQDPELISVLREKKIPLEVCITSNVFTGKYVKSEEHHPVKHFFDQGVTVTINTDDPEIFAVTLSDEYFKLYDKLNFSIDDIISIIKTGVYSTFHSDKDQLWNSMSGKIQQLRQKYQV